MRKEEAAAYAVALRNSGRYTQVRAASGKLGSRSMVHSVMVLRVGKVTPDYLYTDADVLAELAKGAVKG